MPLPASHSVVVLTCALAFVLGCGRAAPAGECGSRPADARFIAVAGPDRTVRVGAPVVLNASLSIAPDQAELQFEWSFVAVPQDSAATFRDATIVNPHFVPDVEGDYVARLVVGDGCSRSSPVLQRITATLTGAGPGPGTNSPPVAHAGTGQVVEVNSTVHLNGQSSYDPDGDPITYEWKFVSTPSNTSVSLTAANTATPSFWASIEGTYVLELVVSDGRAKSAPSNVFVSANGSTSGNLAPVANAGADVNAQLGATVTLDGTASADPEGQPLSYIWTLTKKPMGSAAALLKEMTAKAELTPDLAGAYEATLVVYDGARWSEQDVVAITAAATVTGTIATLDHRVIDAEYSRALDRVITVSESPNRLNIYDPLTDSATHVALNLAPTAVSVGPDGKYAAVGHNGWISWVDLQQASVIKTISVTCDVLDIVLAGNGYAYAFPRIDQWERIRSVNLTTGTESLHTGYSIYAGTRARLHPSGTAIYGADNGLSPSDIEKYDISQGNAVMAYDSPYHGTYPMCGDVWLSEDGGRIFTGCGNVFWSSVTKSQDMLYAGALPGISNVQYLDHSTAANKVIALPRNGWNQTGQDTKLRYYDASYLTFDKEVVLPVVSVASGAHTTHGRFAFFDSTATKQIVIVQLSPAAGAALDFGVVVY